MISCVSVKKYNERLVTPISPEKLKEDVDFTYKKLQELHPNLYWYISKDSLDYKFDSLKTSLKKPLNPQEFSLELQSVIAKVKEGHLQLSIPAKKLTKKESQKLKNQKGLFSRMNYVISDDKIYVKDNAENFENIKVGTEIQKIQDIEAKKYLDRYKRLINSDGYNTTYQKYSMARRWASYFTIENGILDSVKITTKYNGDVKDFYIHREKMTKEQKKKDEDNNKKISKSEKGKTKDFNPVTKSFNRDLQFLEKDSSVAYIKIKTFSGVYSSKFYKETFEKINKSHSKYLILDIRDNLGGSLAEINNLYSYLALDKFQFLKDIEVTKKTSLLHANFFNQIPLLSKPIAVATYPIYFLGSLFSTKKSGDKFLLKNNNIFTIKNPKKTNFKGELYVLINGSSFSASSIISSKIKNDKRGILVGEETGGANDGSVAGRYSTETLPNSKIKLPIGLMLIKGNIEPTNTMKGVTPNVEIIPSLQEILQKKDPQLDWVLKKIKTKK